MARSATNSVALKQSASQIASVAKRLNDLREAWLNPPEWTRRVPEVVPLAMAHQQLDAFVAAAYGWADYTADMPDADILARLLALNHARSAT
jgi:hypothetical protein